MPEINTGNVPTIDTPQTPTVTPEIAPQVPQAPVQPTPVPQVTPSVPDRTREQFEKLLENNAKLFEANENLRKELEMRAVAKETFAPINQPPVPTPTPQKATVDPQDFIEIDPVTGDRFIDEGRLKARIDQINDEASRASKVVQEYTKAAEQREKVAEQREIDRQNKETFAVYPELDNSKPETFDRNFSNNTRALIYDSLINPQDYGGNSLTFKEAATIVREQNQGKNKVQETPAGTPEKTPEQLSKEAQTLKQNASASVNGQQPLERANEVADVTLESLRLKTRLGDRDALAQRIYAAEEAAKNDTV